MDDVGSHDSHGSRDLSELGDARSNDSLLGHQGDTTGSSTGSGQGLATGSGDLKGAPSDEEIPERGRKTGSGILSKMVRSHWSIFSLLLILQFLF